MWKEGGKDNYVYLLMGRCSAYIITTFRLWNQFPLVAVFTTGENLVIGGPQEDRNVNSYWKPSIVKIWSPINIIQVRMHLSNEKPRRWPGVSPSSIRPRPQDRTESGWKGQLGKCTMDFGHVYLTVSAHSFLKLNLMCWKYPLDELMNWKRYWYSNSGGSKASLHHHHPCLAWPHIL